MLEKLRLLPFGIHEAGRMTNDGQCGQIRVSSNIRHPGVGLAQRTRKTRFSIVCEALALGDAVRIDGAGARKKRELFRRVTAT